MTLRVRDVMTQQVVTLDRNDKLVIADDVMRLGRIRHIPVVDAAGELCGIVSQRDLFHSGLLKALGFGSHAQRQALDLVAVKDAMKTNVLTTTPDTLLAIAAQMMLDNKIGCLVVTQSRKILGILTESDFVRILANTANPNNESAARE